MPAGQEDQIYVKLTAGYMVEPPDFTINPDGSVDSKGAVSCWDESIENGHINVRFGTVSSWFQVDLENAKLTSLLNFPSHIEGNMKVSKQPGLTSLDHAPSYIGLSVDLSNCGITSLRGLPRIGSKENYNEKGKDVVRLRLYGNPLTDLHGIETSLADYVYVSAKPMTPMLRMISLKDPRCINIVAENGSADTEKDSKSEEIQQVLRDHCLMYHRDSKHKAILSCQRSLMNLGFHGNAKW